MQVGRLERVKKALIVGKYPDWFSSYVISAYTELGEFDSQTEKFNAREPGSATLLPEVNTEALYRAYKKAARYYKSGKLESADFSELYGKEVAVGWNRAGAPPGSPTTSAGASPRCATPGTGCAGSPTTTPDSSCW